MTPPSEAEVFQYIKVKKGWPDEFCKHYAEKFWNFYESKGWTVGKVKMKSWQAAFNSQWQHIRDKHDIELLTRLQAKKAPIQMKTETEIDRLDSLLAQYKAKFESVPFEEFGKWYDFLKENRLLKEFTKQDVELIRAAYPGDNYKCRCAAVRDTFSGYINTGITFGEIMNIRRRLAG